MESKLISSEKWIISDGNAASSTTNFYDKNSLNVKIVSEIIKSCREATSEFTEENTAYKDSLNDANSNEEEYTPKLFTDDQNQKETEQRDIESESGSHQLFDQDVNEDEDFEIPAFLRRQKF